MQLGTRWAIGAEPPPRLPSTVVSAVAAVETDLAEIDTTGWRWTLTWLEGKPVVELDDGTILRYDASSDSVTVDTHEGEG
ncbi:MAG TPA: hypothetical protein VNS80_08715 [Pseudolysinimonas sp.]|nr:hypothetical protein [Pseudolysinimonas sp.]